MKRRWPYAVLIIYNLSLFILIAWCVWALQSSVPMRGLAATSRGVISDDAPLEDAEDEED